MKKLNAYNSRLKNITLATCCNLPEGSLTLEADKTFLTNANPEIGIAPPKALNSQLVALGLLLCVNDNVQYRLDQQHQAFIVQDLHELLDLLYGKHEYGCLIKNNAS